MAVIPITYNLRSLMVRRTTSLMTAFGVALVVMVVVILLSFVGGLRASLELAGEPGNWIILSRGTVSEGESYIPREQSDLLRTRPEIATDASGKALFSPEMVVPFNAGIKRPATQFQPASLRGVTPIAYEVHRALKQKGPIRVPREFVFMDRAAIGLGGVFLHLAAKLNYYRLFNEAIENFSVTKVGARQKAALAKAGLVDAGA